jgi:RHS repeat-associated protein
VLSLLSVRKVNAGDKIDAVAWTRFEEKASFNKNFDLIALSSLLGSSFVSRAGFEGYTVSQAASTIEAALLAGNFPDDGAENNRPFAYLSYMVYDNNMGFVDAGWVRVPQAAGTSAAALYLPENKPIRFGFENTITVEQAGYVYIWVGNQSEQARVWFACLPKLFSHRNFSDAGKHRQDDITVTHTQTMVTQATDYGVWGDVLREMKAAEFTYRFGYQGQFAEKDEETGWNHFELREYDAVIGRWTATDPANQYWSSYIGMGNNPISGVDPDGGFQTRFGAWLYRTFNGGGEIFNDGDEWVVQLKNRIDHDDSGTRYWLSYATDWGNGNKSFGDHLWNHPVTRFYIPDFVNISFMNFQGVSGVGGSMDFDLVWALRGPEASWKPMITATPSLGGGLDVGSTSGIGGYNYLGPANEIRRDFVNTAYPVVGGYASISVAELGLKAGLTVTVSPAGRSYLVGRQINGGIGYPTVGQGSVGIFNTFTLYDFYKK